MKRATLAATLLCCVAGPALAQSTPQAMSPQDQRKLESLSKDQAATKAQATTTINVLAQNQSECLKAIGNAYFRNCIAQAIPVGLDFIGYVTVLSRSKGVQTLSAADKTLVDAPRQARDKCVNLAGKNATTAPATSGIALPLFNPLFTPPAQQ
jgi:hypothetical protein